MINGNVLQFGTGFFGQNNPGNQISMMLHLGDYNSIAPFKGIFTIFINGDFLGVAGGCGYILGNGAIDTFMINKTTGIADEKLKHLLDDIPVMTADQAHSHTGFIQDEVDQILKAYENAA